MTHHPASSVAAGAASAATAHTLDLLVFLQLFLRHTADAGAVEVGLLCLDAGKATELKSSFSRALAIGLKHKDTYLLIALLFPLRDQVRIGVLVLEQPLIQLLADRLLLVVQIVNVPRACVRNRQSPSQSARNRKVEVIRKNDLTLGGLYRLVYIQPPAGLCRCFSHGSTYADA